MDHNADRVDPCITLVIVLVVVSLFVGFHVGARISKPAMVIGPSEPMPGINIVPYEDEDGKKRFEIQPRHWDVELLTGEDVITLYNGDTFLLARGDWDGVTFRLKAYHSP